MFYMCIIGFLIVNFMKNLSVKFRPYKPNDQFFLFKVFVPNGTSIAQRIVTNSAISTVELLAIIADRDAEIKQLRNELLQVCTITEVVVITLTDLKFKI